MKKVRDIHLYHNLSISLQDNSPIFLPYQECNTRLLFQVQFYLLYNHSCTSLLSGHCHTYVFASHWIHGLVENLNSMFGIVYPTKCVLHSLYSPHSYQFYNPSQLGSPHFSPHILKIEKHARAVLGQAQLKLGLDFTSINLKSNWWTRHITA